MVISARQVWRSLVVRGRPGDGVRIVLDGYQWVTIVGDMSRKRISLSVSDRLYAAVKARADSVGVPVTSYVTTLLVVDVNPPETNTRAGVRSAKEKKP